MDQVVLRIGDRFTVADRVRSEIGADVVASDGSLEDSVRRLKEERSRSATVTMGDGTNDALSPPAVPVGMARGVTAASAAFETADAVIAVDRLAGGLLAAPRATSIARQSVAGGVGPPGKALAFAMLA